MHNGVMLMCFSQNIGSCEKKVLVKTSTPCEEIPELILCDRFPCSVQPCVARDDDGAPLNNTHRKSSFALSSHRQR